jgi:hypothetical protein
MRMQGCHEVLEILRMHANDSAARAIDIGDTKKRDRNSNGQNQKQ